MSGQGVENKASGIGSEFEQLSEQEMRKILYQMAANQKAIYSEVSSDEEADKIEQIRGLKTKYNEENTDRLFVLQTSRRGSKWLSKYSEEFNKSKDEILSVMISSLVKREDEMNERLATRFFMKGELSEDRLADFLGEERISELKNRRQLMNEVG